MALGIEGSYESYGFQLGVATGVIAAGAAAAAEYVNFRWSAGVSGPRARIIAVSTSLVTDAVGFTGGAVLVELVRATGFSALGSGGSAVTFAAKPQAALRSGQPPTRGMTATVAAAVALTAGTRTLDTNAMASVLGGSGSAAGAAVISNTFLIGDNHAYGVPLVLDNNEGFIIRATVPATGTWRLAATAFWAEIDGN
jgi:hypothetical protein